MSNSQQRKIVIACAWGMLILSADPAKSEMAMIIGPERVGGLVTDMYIDVAKIGYSPTNRVIKIEALSNFGSPPQFSQRYTYVLDCESGSQHMTNRVLFTGPMATGQGREIPDTDDSVLKTYPSKTSIKGLLQDGLCKRVAKFPIQN